jgi:IS30 family transposase
MQKEPRNIITEDQWRAAIDAYELGRKHASQIATDLGVSPATVSREFKRRGARKACRVAESIAPLVAELDAKDRRLAPLRRAKEAAAMERLAAINGLIDEMMKGIIAADRAGNLAAAASVVERVRRSLAG